MEGVQDTDVWSNEDSSQVFRQHMEQVVQSCQSGQQSIMDLVKKLGAQLTSTDDSLRYKGTLVLAEVAEKAPEAFADRNDLHHLALFFSSRMADWPCFRPALTGCLALAKISRTSGGKLRLSADDAAAALDAVHEVNVRGLLVKDRQLCLELLIALYQGNGAELLLQSVNLIEAGVVALDGERDPRCLLLAFQSIRDLSFLYAEHSPEGLESKAEEIVEVLGCYFPIVFTPPPNMAGSVTRQELATAVEQTMAATPALAPYVIPLLLEKLSSSLRQAREDALSLLAACARNYGAPDLRNHLPRIWSGLRPILIASIDSSFSPEEKAEAEGLSSHAIKAVSALAVSFSGNGDLSMVDMVLKDSLVRDLLEDAVDPAQHGGLAGSAARLEAATPVIAAVAESSTQAADRVSQSLLGSLMKSTAQSLGPGSDHSATDYSMAFMAILVKASQKVYADEYHRATSNSPQHGSERGVNGLSLQSGSQNHSAAAAGSSAQSTVLAGKGSDLFDLAVRSATLCTQQQSGASSAAGLRETVGDARHNLSSTPSIAYPKHELQVLSCLLSFPATHPALSAPLQRKALLAMLSAFSRQRALSAASASTPPQQNDGIFPSEPMLEDCPYIEQAVVPAFEAMAGLGHDSLLDRDTLPMLYDTAELNSASIAVSSPASVLDEGRGSKAPNDQQAGSVYVHRGQWRRTIALHALARIACTCSSLRQPILARLTEAIPAALADSSGTGLLDVLASAELLQQGGEAMCQKIASTLLTYFSSNSQAHGAVPGEVLVQSTDRLMQLAACHAWSRQEELAAAAEHSLTQAVSNAEAGGSTPGVWLAAVPAASALSVLPPISDAPRLAKVASGLVTIACSAAPRAVAELAADSAAAVVNKASTGLVDETLKAAWPHGVLPRLQQGDGAAANAAGKMGRALAMRAHPKSQEIMRAAIDLASIHSSREHSTADLAHLAPCILQKMVQPVEEAQPGTAKCRQLSNERPFWQQRTFSMASSTIVQRLEEAGEDRSKESLLVCMAAMLGMLEPQLVRPQWQQLMPWMVSALHPVGRHKPELQPALLSSLQQALRDPHGRTLLEADIKGLIAGLLHEAEQAQQAAQRSAALHCLQDAMQMPYDLLHPLQPEVMSVLGRAVDDRKRDVRMAAVRCRRVWTAPQL